MRTSIKMKLTACCMATFAIAVANEPVIPESAPHPDKVYDYAWNCNDGKLIVGNNPFSDEWRCTIIGMDGKPLLKGEYGEIIGPDKYGYYSVKGTDGSQMWLSKDMKLTKGKHPVLKSEPQLVYDEQTNTYYIESARGKRKLRVAKNRNLQKLCGDRIIFCEHKPDLDDIFLYGIMDLYGNVIVKAKYMEIQPFSEGVAMVNNGGDMWGGIDKNGKPVVPYVFRKPDFDPDTDVEWGFHDGLISVERTYEETEEDYTRLVSKTGFADKKGKIVIPCQYLYAENFENGKAYVSIGYHNGSYTGFFIDTKGEKTEPPAGEITAFPSDTGEGKMGFQTYDGKELLPAVYDDVLAFKGEYALVKVGEHWHLIDRTGRVILRDIAYTVGMYVYPG